jgi:hypothetical protein
LSPRPHCPERFRDAGADHRRCRGARIVRGFASGAFEIHFPRRFTRVLKLLSILPDRLYFRLIARSTGL